VAGKWKVESKTAQQSSPPSFSLWDYQKGPTATAWRAHRHSVDLVTTVHGGPVHDTSAVAEPARTSVNLSGWPPRRVLAKICVAVGLGPAGQDL